MEMTIEADQFEAKCLKLLDDIAQAQIEIIITKDGHPIAKLGPLSGSTKSLFGALRGTVLTTGDLISPIDETWEAGT